MKVTCEKEKLSHLVQAALRAVSTRVTMPILSGILLSAEAGRMTACGTDLEISVKAFIDADTGGGGSTVVSGKMIGEIVKSLPAGPVELESGERFLTLRSGGGEYRIREMMSEDFPAVPDWEGEPVLKCSPSIFYKAVQQTSRASSSDEKRPVLTGTLIEKNLEAGRLRAVTTDSYRLSWKDVEVEGVLENWEDCVIPTRSLSEVSRLASSAETGVEMRIQDKQVMFKVDDIVVRSRLIEGQFPHYRQLVPKGERTTAGVSKEELVSVLKRALVFGHNLRLGIYGDHITIKTETPEVGESTESLEAEVDGEEMEVGFNGVYLMDGVTSVDGDKVEIRMDDSQKPVLLAATEDAGFIYILMPVRLK